jgi:hypothetical protein
MVSYGVDPSSIILDAKLTLFLLFQIPYKIQDCMTLDHVIYLQFSRMIGHELCNIATYCDARKSSLVSSPFLYKSLKLYMIIWYPRIEDIIEGANFH